MGIIRDTCSFFRSIYEGSMGLKPLERLEIYESIFDYMFYDVERENVKPTTRLVLMSNKIAFDNAKTRYDNALEAGERGRQYGHLGGAPKGNQNAKKQPKNDVIEGQNNPKTTQNNPPPCFKQPKTTPRVEKNNPKQPQEIEIERDIEIEVESVERKREESMRGERKGERPALTRFRPPALEEVVEYCNERKNAVDAERFLDYYTANGWKVGKNPMKDWRAAVRTWERSSVLKEESKCAPKTGTEREYSKSQLDKLYDNLDEVKI